MQCDCCGIALKELTTWLDTNNFYCRECTITITSMLIIERQRIEEERKHTIDNQLANVFTGIFKRH